jgi:hypothetical protein
MNAELLLYWMSTVAEGSWRRFRYALAELAPEDTDVQALARRVRVLLADLGHADFFIDGSQRWQVAAPTLAGLLEKSSAVFCGGRSPALLDRLQGAAEAAGCTLSRTAHGEGLVAIRVDGDGAALRQAAARSGIPYIPDLAISLAGAGTTVLHQLRGAPTSPPPIRWTVRTFDWDRRRWADATDLSRRESGTVWDCESRSERRFLVCGRRRHLFVMPKREAVWAAASLRGVRLAVYNPARGTLVVPFSAPLPDRFARAACLASGCPARVENGDIRYDGIPPHLAAVILVALGQPHADIHPSKP